MSDGSDMEYSSDNECGYDDYYNTGLLTSEILTFLPCHDLFIIWNVLFNNIGTEDIDIEHHNALKTDPESFVFECLSVEDVDKLLNESIECLCNMIKCAPSLAKTLLLEHRWSVNEIVKSIARMPQNSWYVIYSTQTFYRM